MSNLSSINDKQLKKPLLSKKDKEKRSALRVDKKPFNPIEKTKKEK